MTTAPPRPPPADALARAGEKLRRRPDYRREFDPFLRRLEEGPAAAARGSERPLVGVLCQQAPLELFHALGIRTHRLCGGGEAPGTASRLPALACPLLRAAAAGLARDGAWRSLAGWVIPLACDWAARFPAILSQYGIELPDPFCFLEPPRLREAGDGRERWRAEIGRLAAFLEKLAGRPLAAARLRDSLALYRRAWGALERLTEKRRRGEVPGVWFFLIANSFLRGDPESWLAALEEALPGFGEPPARDAPRIFLAGSPIFFPDFKLPELLEEAGFALVADDLCSSERIFPGAAFYRDPSLPGMLQALAERHHQGSGCPVFADDRNRPASILGQAKHFEGVVFHILKGCHPYDMDSRGVEAALGKRGIPFLRLETDLAPGDRENLLVRLEAFRAILQRGRRGRSGRA